MKILIFSLHSVKYIWNSPQKSKYPLFISDAPSVTSVSPTGTLRRMASFSVNKITGQRLEKLAMGAQK